jgi:hypothetical protein
MNKLANYQAGFDMATQIAVSYTGGENEIDRQSCRIAHLKTLLAELPASASLAYVQGWQMRINLEEQALREYLKAANLS